MEPQDAERNKGTQGGGRSQGSQKASSANQPGTTGGQTSTAQQSGEKSSMNQRRKENREHNSDGIKNTPIWGIIGAVAAGTLLYRGATGRFPFMGSSRKSSGKRTIEIHSKMQVNKSREELYDYWRNLENLPNFMTHLKEVQEIDEKRSLWTAKIPGGMGTVEWDAEIVRERKNHLLAWRSLPDSEIENSGEVRFENAPEGKGTIVETTISYRPPAGEIGTYAAKLFNPAFEKVIKSDLKEFKKLMEKGGAAKRKSSPASRM